MENKLASMALVLAGLVLGPAVANIEAETLWFELDPQSEGYVSPTEILEHTTAGINIVSDSCIMDMSVGALTVNNTGAVANQGVSQVGTLAPNLTFHPIGSSNGMLRPGGVTAMGICVI